MVVPDGPATAALHERRDDRANGDTVIVGFANTRTGPPCDELRVALSRAHEMIADRGALGGGVARDVGGDGPRRAGVDKCRRPKRKRAGNTEVVGPLGRPVPEAGLETVRHRPMPSCRISPESVASRIALQRRLGNTVVADAAPVESMPSRRASSRISTARLHRDVAR